MPLWSYNWHAFLSEDRVRQWTGPRLYFFISYSFRLIVSFPLRLFSYGPWLRCINGHRLPYQSFFGSEFGHVLRVHTALPRPPPALSSARCMYGPIKGTFPANPPIVEKKSPKSTNIPYISIRKPINGHRTSMSMIPAANAIVPFIFWGRAKKIAVLYRPIIRVRPRRKRICSRMISFTWFGKCPSYIAHGQPA